MSIKATQPEDSAVHVEAVATIVRRNGELEIDWLVEGGISALECEGVVLYTAERPITDDDGSGEVYLAIPSPQPAEAKTAAVDGSAVPVCGENPTPVDADLVGCGKPIERPEDVYRCTDCAVPFHRACAVRHFETDTPEHSSKVFEEQLRRLDAKDAAIATQEGG